MGWGSQRVLGGGGGGTDGGRGRRGGPQRVLGVGFFQRVLSGEGGFQRVRGEGG